MGEELKNELRSKGFIITEKGHVAIMTLISVLIFLGGLFTLYAVNYSDKEQLKSKVESHEERLNSIEQIFKQNNETQLEIKLNLKVLMEKQGLKYQTN